MKLYYDRVIRIGCHSILVLRDISIYGIVGKCSYVGQVQMTPYGPEPGGLGLLISHSNTIYEGLFKNGRVNVPFLMTKNNGSVVFNTFTADGRQYEIYHKELEFRHAKRLEAEELLEFGFETQEELTNEFEYSKYLMDKGKSY